MPVALLWIILAGPLALAAVGAWPVVAHGRRPTRTVNFALAASLASVVVAVLTATAVGWSGTLRTETVGADGIGIALYLDSLSATMFCLVSFIGLIVVNYSKNYMDGDPGQEQFTRGLCATLAAVLLVIVSGNMLLFLAAWIATSLGLHRLLVFYPDRPAAQLAARKKYLVSRLGDAALLGAMWLIYRQFHSLDYAAVFGAARGLSPGSLPPDLSIAALLLVLTAVLKSAQFPLHGWLLEVMETPTPVSALLHAGIINAGGFLILRYAALVSLSPTSLRSLAVIGGFTAVFGSVVMLTQTSIKVSLACSTVAQMGFMMLECGLGVFSAAVLHIVAHSLYKAHAFLSSGSIIDIARSSWNPAAGGRPHPARLVIALTGVLAVALAAGALFGAAPTQKPGVFALGAVVVLGLVHLMANAIDERPDAYVVGATLIRAALVAVSYFALQRGVERLYATSLPEAPPLRSSVDLALVVAIVVSFSLVTLTQGLVLRPSTRPRWQSLYALVANGFYVNTIANRWLQRLWPGEPRAVAAVPSGMTRSTGVPR